VGASGLTGRRPRLHRPWRCWGAAISAGSPNLRSSCYIEVARFYRCQARQKSWRMGVEVEPGLGSEMWARLHQANGDAEDYRRDGPPDRRSAKNGRSEMPAAQRIGAKSGLSAPVSWRRKINGSPLRVVGGFCGHSRLWRLIGLRRVSTPDSIYEATGTDQLNRAAGLRPDLLPTPASGRDRKKRPGPELGRAAARRTPDTGRTRSAWVKARTAQVGGPAPCALVADLAGTPGCRAAFPQREPDRQPLRRGGPVVLLSSQWAALEEVRSVDLIRERNTAGIARGTSTRPRVGGTP